jgi:ADP-ribose pyrophosphatase YjhB (NUDIX family)
MAPDRGRLARRRPAIQDKVRREMNDSESGSPDRLDLWPPRMVVCVGAVVLNGDRMLFVRQAPEHSLAGQWSIPWGLVDGDECPEDAALRETYEEGGIRATLDGLLGFQNLQPGWLGLIFLCRHQEGDPTADGVETDAAAYLSLPELEALGATLEPWCGWLARRVLAGTCTVAPPAMDSPYHPRKAFL